MNILVEKTTDVNALRRAASITTGRPCRMTLAAAYRARHSLIRTQRFWIELRDIPLCVASHLVRHHVGVQPYQRSHRPDRNPQHIDQGRQTPTDLALDLDAEAILNISRARLCAAASAETRAIWSEVIDKLRDVDPDLADHCVRPCVATGICRERKCSYINTPAYEQERANYLDLFRK